MTKKSFVAYYTIPKKKGLSLNAQRAILSHFAKLDKATIEKEFINNGDVSILKQAIKYSIKHQITFMIASLDCLSDDIDLIISTKKKLGSLFQSCDLPAQDSLSLSIAFGLNQRAKELVSIKTKAALKIKKMEGKSFGHVQNLTGEGRKLGLAKIKAKATSNKQQQKILTIIAKCRMA